jgi:preprotein translocase subunit SecF
MFDFVGKRYWYFLFSLAVIIPGLISLIMPPHLKAGIEFSSGTSMTLRFERPVGQADLRAAFADLGHRDAIIRKTGGGDYDVRTRTLEGQKVDPTTGEVTVAPEKDRLEQALRDRFGPVTVLEFGTVSPIVAREIVRSSIYAVIAAAVGILLYITWAFRRLPSPFRYGTCAVIALGHDVLVVVGLFSIFGRVFDIEVDPMFITGMLTVIGYSVHDSIVVFDRIRENLRRGFGFSFETTVNNSILETLARSLNTTITVVFVLSALLLLGGSTIRDFILVLLIGIISGAYSSIFNASQLLVVWEKNDLGRFFRRITNRQAVTTEA